MSFLPMLCPLLLVEQLKNNTGPLLAEILAHPGRQWV